MATLRQPRRSAVFAMASGSAGSLVSSVAGAAGFQFWQNLHVRLQPAVPKESTGVPGKK